MNPHTPIPMGSSQQKGPTTMPVPQPPTNGDKKQHTWVYVLIGLAILGGLWYFLSYKPAEAPGGEETSEEEEVSENQQSTTSLTSPSFLWEFSPSGGNSETGAPRTEVTLSVNGETRSIGTFDGSCLVINGSSWELAQNELTGVICWFGGAGDEIGVFYEEGVYVVKQGVLEEGVEGESGMRGNYETLFTL